MDVNVMDIPGIPEFLDELKTIPWLRPDGSLQDGQDGIRLYSTYSAANSAARKANLVANQQVSAWDDVRRCMRPEAFNIMRDYASYDAQYAAEKAELVPAFSAVHYAVYDAAHEAVQNAVPQQKYVPPFLGVPWEAAWDAVTYAQCMYTCAGLPVADEDIDHMRKRMDIWRHGYGVVADVNGVLYCYEEA